MMGNHSASPRRTPKGKPRITPYRFQEVSPGLLRAEMNEMKASITEMVKKLKSFEVNTIREAIGTEVVAEMQIFVKTSTGLMLTVDVEPSNTSELLMCKIQNKKGFRLMTSDGKQLQAGGTLMDYNVLKGSTLTEVGTLHGDGKRARAPAAPIPLADTDVKLGKPEKLAQKAEEIETLTVKLNMSRNMEAARIVASVDQKFEGATRFVQEQLAKLPLQTLKNVREGLEGSNNESHRVSCLAKQIFMSDFDQCEKHKKHMGLVEAYICAKVHTAVVSEFQKGNNIGWAFFKEVVEQVRYAKRVLHCSGA
jgi:hypothetical protein